MLRLAPARAAAPNPPPPPPPPPNIWLPPLELEEEVGSAGNSASFLSDFVDPIVTPETPEESTARAKPDGADLDDELELEGREGNASSGTTPGALP